MNPASDKCLTIASDTAGTLKALTVAAGDTVNIAFGDGVDTSDLAGTKLISWSGAPEGDFEFADVTTPKCYRLEKRENGLYLVARVLGIPFIHDIEKWSEVVIVLLFTINAVIDSDESDILVRKHNLRVEADLQIISSESAHILNDNHSDFTGLDIL